MTPEEKAVIDAAMGWRDAVLANPHGGTDLPAPVIDALTSLGAATYALAIACPTCDAGGHTCPGCGAHVGHAGNIACSDCEYRCSCSANRREYCAANNCRGGIDVKDWTPATLLYCLAGDRIRIGADETDVLRSSSGAWHANVVSSVMPSGKTWDKVTPWEHIELKLDLSANPGFQQYKPNTPCEILCSPERLAVLTLMTVFPGTKELAHPA